MTRRGFYNLARRDHNTIIVVIGRDAPPISDWRRANESLHGLLDEHVPTDVWRRDEEEQQQEDDEQGSEEEEEEEDEDLDEEERRERVLARLTGPPPSRRRRRRRPPPPPPPPPPHQSSSSPSSRGPRPTPLSILEQSAPLCLSLAHHCKRHGWRCAWVSLTLRAASLDPSSNDAKLRCGEALLANGRASEAIEAFSAALDLDDELIEAIGGQAAALDALGRHDEAARLWARVRNAPLHSAPPQKGPRAQWYVVCARARVASGDLFGAEELLLSFLQSNDDADAQGEYASILELQYLSEVETEGPAASAVPQPPPRSEGRDKLSSAFDAWQAVLRLSPDDAKATARLALVEHELATLCADTREAKSYSTRRYHASRRPSL